MYTNLSCPLTSEDWTKHPWHGCLGELDIKTMYCENIKTLGEWLLQNNCIYFKISVFFSDKI